MIATLLLAWAVPLGGAGLLEWGSWFSGDSPIEIWASKTHGLRYGERVRLYARSESDGYLVVLHAEPSGRVRVLYPLDPPEDNYMRGGTSYELRGRGGREAFEIFDRSGYGTVLAAFSRDPFRFDAFTRGDHWDYAQPDLWRASSDPEGHLLSLVDRMATGRYDYDVLRYEVVDYVAYRSRPVRLSLYGAHWDDHYHGGLHVSVFLSSPWFHYVPYLRPLVFYPLPVYYYPPVYYAPLLVAGWYDPFFDPYFPYYWYRRAYYVVYHPGYYYAYYSAYYPAYRYRDVGVRYTGGYTFKSASQPPVIEPRRRALLAAAVTRRLVSPDNFSAPAFSAPVGSSVRRSVVSEPVASPPAAKPAGGAGRRLLDPSARERAQPASGDRVEPRRRSVVTERAPVASGEVPRRVGGREPDHGRSLGAEARRPVAPSSNDRPLEQVDRLRRLVPQARERTGLPSQAAGPAEPRRGWQDEIDDRDRRLTDAIPSDRSGGGLPARRENLYDRYDRAVPGSPQRETQGVEERARRAPPAIGERRGELVPQGHRPPARAVPDRAGGWSSGMQRLGELPSMEARASRPAVAAPPQMFRRILVPEAPRRVQRAEPTEAGGGRRP